MLPQGMFSVAVAAVLFPALSRLAAGGRRARLPRARRHGAAADRVPAAARRGDPAAFAIPIVRLLYEHGHFTPADTDVVAASLAAFSLGLAFNGAMLLLNRAFFSMQKAWVPTYVAIANLTVNATLDWVFSRSLGIWSIPLATSIANIFGVALLYLELRPIAGRLDERELLRAFVRIAVATALAVGVGYGVWRGLDTLLGQFLPFQFITLGGGLAATIGVYGLAARAMKIEELDDRAGPRCAAAAPGSG